MTFPGTPSAGVGFGLAGPLSELHFMNIPPSTTAERTHISITLLMIIPLFD
jgi:hypothetical protein